MVTNLLLAPALGHRVSIGELILQHTLEFGQRQSHSSNPRRVAKQLALIVVHHLKVQFVPQLGRHHLPIDSTITDENIELPVMLADTMRVPLFSISHHNLHCE